MKDSEGFIKFSKGSVYVSKTECMDVSSFRSIASIVSIGTELRQLKMSKTNDDIFAGYMNVVSINDNHLWLLPSSHGSCNSLARNDARALKFHKEIPLHYIAAARFQLITAVNIKNMNINFEMDKKLLILGSGPVSVGAFFEAMRISITNIFVQDRLYEIFSSFPNCHKLNEVRSHSFDIVFDCKGCPDSAFKYVKNGGIIAIIGTPDNATSVDALQIHRRGIILLGFHELIPSSSLYVSMFDLVVNWLLTAIDGQFLYRLTSFIPGDNANDVYQHVSHYVQKKPFIIFQWSSL